MNTNENRQSGIHQAVIGRWIPAALLGIGMLLLGLCIQNGFRSMADNSRVITVRGLCDSTVMADKVTWPIVSKEVGNDLATIYANIQRTNNAITDFLKRNGVRQEEIAVNAPAVIDMQADRFNSQPAPFRYNVTTVVVVTSDRVKEINALISRQSELLK